MISLDFLHASGFRFACFIFFSLLFFFVTFDFTPLVEGRHSSAFIRVFTIFLRCHYSLLGHTPDIFATLFHFAISFLH